jgi:hypothetical protein
MSMRRLFTVQFDAPIGYEAVPRMDVLLPPGFATCHWRYAEVPLAIAVCTLAGYPAGLPANDPEFGP